MRYLSGVLHHLLCNGDNRAEIEPVGPTGGEGSGAIVLGGVSAVLKSEIWPSDGENMDLDSSEKAGLSDRFLRVRKNRIGLELSRASLR